MWAAVPAGIKSAATPDARTRAEETRVRRVNISAWKGKTVRKW